MLVISRKINESIVINDDIEIVVIQILGDKVRLGVRVPPNVPVHRREVFDAIRRTESSREPRDELTPAATAQSRAGAAAPQSPAPVAIGGATLLGAAPLPIDVAARHAALLDRLAAAIHARTGTAPCRDQVLAAMLDALEAAEASLAEAQDLADLTDRVTRTMRRPR